MRHKQRQKSSKRVTVARLASFPSQNRLMEMVKCNKWIKRFEIPNNKTQQIKSIQFYVVIARQLYIATSSGGYYPVWSTYVFALPLRSNFGCFTLKRYFGSKWNDDPSTCSSYFDKNHNNCEGMDQSKHAIKGWVDDNKWTFGCSHHAVVEFTAIIKVLYIHNNLLPIGRYSIKDSRILAYASLYPPLLHPFILSFTFLSSIL